MAKSTAEERRLRRVGLAQSAEDRARARRLDADYADRDGDHARAAIYRTAADRHEASARQHRQEAARLAQRAKARRYRTDPADKARQALAALPVAKIPAPDSLDRYGAALAEIAAIRVDIARLELQLSELPRQASGGARHKIVTKIETQRARALEWEREAERFALASPDDYDQSRGNRSGESHSPLNLDAADR